MVPDDAETHPQVRWRVIHAPLLSLFLGCGPSQPATDPGDASRPATNLFSTGSAAEVLLAEELAEAHIVQSPKLVATDLRRLRTQIDTLSTAHVRYTQEVGGVPVFGAQLIVHLDPDGSTRATTDRLLRDVQATNDVLYTPSEAVDAATEATGGWGTVTNHPTGDLVILRHGGLDRHVYRVRVERFTPGDTSIPVVFLDAQTAEVVFEYDDLQTAETGTADTVYNGPISFPVTAHGGFYGPVGDRVGTYDLNHTDHNPVVAADFSDFAWTDEDLDFDDEDDVASDVQFGFHTTDQYFDLTHGRDGIDDSAGPTPYGKPVMTAGVHYGVLPADTLNAYWNGQGLVFGDGGFGGYGPFTSLDIVAHEYTHGVTQETAGLVYFNEFGALNESMSDVFAAAVEAFVPDPHDLRETWEVGEQIHAGGPLRYMSDPTADGSSTDHYATRYIGNADRGGVHWNSGIPNLAFYLLSEGGSHPNPARSVDVVSGIGIEKAARIWYRALTTYMTPQTDFHGAWEATVLAAEDLPDVTPAEVQAVHMAWAEVGVAGPQVGGFAFNLSGATGSWTYFTTTSPYLGMTVSIFGGTGDADLYVRKDANPTVATYDCRPYQNGNYETCSIAPPGAAGTWNIGIHAFQAYTGLDVHVAPNCSPFWPEIPNNGYDENCDGLDVCGTAAGTYCDPQLAITEIMAIPEAGQAAGGEWIEIENLGAETLDLFGATLTIDGNAYVIDGSVEIDPGEVAVIGDSANSVLNGGVSVDHTWSGVLDLPDAGSTLTLHGWDGGLLDTVIYGPDHGSGGFVPEGASLSLDPLAEDNSATSWCDGRSAFGAGDFGTPGAVNEPCAYTIDIAFGYDETDDSIVNNVDITGLTTLSFDFSDTERRFTTGNEGEGLYTRGTVAGVQTLWLQYDGTDVTYHGVRNPGSDCFTGGVMSHLPPLVYNGAWTAPDCPP